MQTYTKPSQESVEKMLEMSSAIDDAPYMLTQESSVALAANSNSSSHSQSNSGGKCKARS